MHEKKETEALEDKTYFINTSVSRELFREVKTKAHKLETTRSEYIRSLILRDLKSEKTVSND